MILAWVGALLWPVLLALGLWHGLKRGRGPGWILWTLIVVVTVAWAMGVRAFLWEPETLEIRRVEVASRSWSGPALRIGVISDTHTDGPHVGVRGLNAVIDRMMAEQPDIVLLLGDFVNGHATLKERSAGEREKINEGLAAFENLKAPLGVWAVLGNHDWWYDGRAVEAALTAEGVRMLENDAVQVARPKAQTEGAFWIAGLADYESGRALPSYSDALKTVPEGEDVIVLSHWPDVFDVAPNRVAVTLAGHSHCGQVNLPLLGRRLHASEGSAKWPCGLYAVDGRQLYVSGGVGVSILPVRFNQPPEIAVVTLKAR